MTTVAILVGSIRQDSINLKLARAIARLGPQDWTWEHVPIHELPLYNQEKDSNIPPAAQQLKSRLSAADALLFVTPEYNRSVPGVLKNAIDTASRPYGKNSFAGKPAGVIGTTGGLLGTALAQQHLRNILAYLDVAVMGQPEAFISSYKEGLIDANGDVTVESTRAFLQGWVQAYQRFVEQHLRSRGA